MKTCKSLIILSLILLFIRCSGEKETADASSLTNEVIEIEHFVDWVNPFIGTDGKGKTYPGATVPFGMVQLSPDNGRNGWDWISGYFYPDSVIAGFSHTHLSGTGIGDLYDISYFPYVNEGNFKELDNDSTSLELYSAFSHTNESASPGYYGVQLLHSDIVVELTATTRVGIQNYNYPEEGERWVQIDLGYQRNWDATIETKLTLVSDTLITGFRFSQGWAPDQRVYFASKLSAPYDEIKTLEDDRQVRLSFDSNADQNLMIKTALSSVSVKNALENMEVEAPHWDFEKYKSDAEEIWNNELSKIRVSTYDDESLTKFYTALYQSMLAPTIYSDVNGEYKGADGKVKKTEGYTRYSTFSLWDTFRAEHPLLTLTQADRVPDMIRSMMAHSEEYGLLPVWDLAANETDMMIGYHAVPVIVDAYLKGIEGFDAEAALEAMLKSARQDDFGLKYRNEMGYIPQELFKESVSLDLEYSYDDWCIYMLAKALGKEDIAAEFQQRADSYRMHFDPESGFMRALDAENQWTDNFDPAEYSDEYIEGNAWQYSWFVPHDVKGLIDLHGGEEPFTQKLDELFDETNLTDGELPVFITGLIGQYVHGNEPAHHVPYLYAMAGQPEKTQSMVRRITSELHKATPDGICGNEDCGQMSAWYIFSALGFYPVNPAGGDYVFGSPLFNETVVSLPNGNKLKIVAKGAEESPYVDEILWNGKVWEGTSINHKDLLEGGTLEFIIKD